MPSFTSGETHGISCGSGGGVRGSGGGVGGRGGSAAAGSGSGWRLAAWRRGSKARRRFDPQQALLKLVLALDQFAWLEAAQAPEMASIRSRSGLAGSSGAGIPFQTTLRIKLMSDSGFPLPPPTFEFLVFSLKTQAEMQLGLFQFGEPSEEPPNLPAARHAIDLLAMIAEKTRGNLALEEQRLIENSLTELRFRFVQVAEQKPPAVADKPADKPETGRETR